VFAQAKSEVCRDGLPMQHDECVWWGGAQSEQTRNGNVVIWPRTSQIAGHLRLCILFREPEPEKTPSPRDARGFTGFQHYKRHLPDKMRSFVESVGNLEARSRVETTF
jgi:hypothetical protein